MDTPSPSNVGRFDKSRQPYGRSGAPLHYERRMLKLLRASDHVSRRYSVRHLTHSYRMRDALLVIEAWQSGREVMTLGEQMLRRLANDDYGSMSGKQSGRPTDAFIGSHNLPWDSDVD